MTAQAPPPVHKGTLLRGLVEAGRQLLDEIGEGKGQANREGRGRGGENRGEDPLAAAPAAAATMATQPCRRRANAKESAIFSTSYAGARPKATHTPWNAMHMLRFMHDASHHRSDKATRWFRRLWVRKNHRHTRATSFL